ncbi:MAG: Crp/Fnr family transcriptional regulator, partial [Spirochaetaceae bacterium]
MNPEKKESIIKSSDFFKELAGPQVRTLAAIALSKSLKKGQFLFHEGDEGNAMFILATGAIQISKNSAEGKEIVIKLLKPVEVFGEVILFQRKDYPAQAIAVTASEVLMLPTRQIDCLLLEPEFRNGFLGMLMNKLRYLTDRILYLTTSDVEERFFLFLKARY